MQMVQEIGNRPEGRQTAQAPRKARIDQSAPRSGVHAIGDARMTAKNLPLMTGPELAKCLDKLEEIESWVRAVRAEALDRAERKADDRAPGWKLTEGRKGDRTANPDDIVRRAHEALKALDPS